MAQPSDTQPSDTQMVRESDAESFLVGLSEAERAHLDARGWVKVVNDLLWREPEGTLRRELCARVYYLHTTHGIFHISGRCFFHVGQLTLSCSIVLRSIPTQIVRSGILLTEPPRSVR